MTTIYPLVAQLHTLDTLEHTSCAADEFATTDKLSNGKYNCSQIDPDACPQFSGSPEPQQTPKLAEENVRRLDKNPCLLKKGCPYLQCTYQTGEIQTKADIELFYDTFVSSPALNTDAEAANTTAYNALLERFCPIGTNILHEHCRAACDTQSSAAAPDWCDTAYFAYCEPRKNDADRGGEPCACTNSRIPTPECFDPDCTQSLTAYRTYQQNATSRNCGTYCANIIGVYENDCSQSADPETEADCVAVHDTQQYIDCSSSTEEGGDTGPPPSPPGPTSSSAAWIIAAVLAFGALAAVALVAYARHRKSRPPARSAPDQAVGGTHPAAPSGAPPG